MLNAQHTQGRLKALNLYATPEIRDQEEIFVAAVGDGLPRSVSNARRLVACWNACIDFPTADLESCPDGGLFHLAAHANELAIQRDELLALLKETDRLYSTYAIKANGGMEVGRWINSVRAAIAKHQPAQQNGRTL